MWRDISNMVFLIKPLFFMRKEKILRRTITHFQNNPRSTGSIETHDKKNITACYYQHPDDPNKRCAIGIWLKDEYLTSKLGSLKCLADEIFEVSSWDDLLIDSVRGHELEFWRDLQALHDTEANWNGNTLTTQGNKAVQRMIDSYNLEPSEVYDMSSAKK